MSRKKDPVHPEYVTITHGMRGYFAVHLWWNPELGGFYEPYQSGIESGETRDAKNVVAEAREWAEDLGVEFRS